MKLIRFADLMPKPWKNGGGTTTEIAIHPEDAGFDDFDWRLSVADVAIDGPFSSFPEIDRTLTVIEGKGLLMTIEGREQITLTPTSLPLAFPGDVPIEARLADGAIRDFNVMTRRGRFRHEVHRHDLRPMQTPLRRAGSAVLFALGIGTLDINGTATPVAWGDTVLTEGDLALRGTVEILICLLNRA